MYFATFSYSSHDDLRVRCRKMCRKTVSPRGLASWIPVTCQTSDPSADVPSSCMILYGVAGPAHRRRTHPLWGRSISWMNDISSHCHKTDKACRPFSVESRSWLFDLLRCSDFCGLSSRDRSRWRGFCWEAVVSKHARICFKSRRPTYVPNLSKNQKSGLPNSKAMSSSPCDTSIRSLRPRGRGMF